MKPRLLLALGLMLPAAGALAANGDITLGQPSGEGAGRCRYKPCCC